MLFLKGSITGLLKLLKLRNHSVLQLRGSFTAFFFGISVFRCGSINGVTTFGTFVHVLLENICTCWKQVLIYFV